MPHREGCALHHRCGNRPDILRVNVRKDVQIFTYDDGMEDTLVVNSQSLKRPAVPIFNADRERCRRSCDDRCRVRLKMYHRLRAWDQVIIVVCQEGFQSSLAAAALQRLGLRNVTDLDGGFAAWREAGLPVVPPGVLPPGPAGVAPPGEHS